MHWQWYVSTAKIVYHVYKDQWDSFLEESLQPIMNAAIPTTVCMLSCSESLTTTTVDFFHNCFPSLSMALFECIFWWPSTEASKKLKPS